MFHSKAVFLTFTFVWTIGFKSSNFVSGFPTQSVVLNSTECYDNQTASWSFLLNFHISPTRHQLRNISSPILFRLTLAFLENSNANSEQPNNSYQLFSCGSTERFHYTEPIFVTNNNSLEGNTTVLFDHVYSGHYKLQIDNCVESRFNCFETVYETDLGVVETSLSNFDVTKMNISIKTSTSVADTGGFDVEFAVHYRNHSNEFIPFEKYEVTLIPADLDLPFHSVVTNINEVKFRPLSYCSADNLSVQSNETAVSCFNITAGQYTIRVDPIDSRCNFPVQVVASIRRPCRRYIISDINTTPSRSRRGGPNIDRISKPDKQANKITIFNSEGKKNETDKAIGLKCQELYCIFKLCLCFID